MFKIKNHLREWYRPHDSFVVRSPLLPVNVFFQWKSEQGTDAKVSKQVLRTSLREFFLQPMAQEALYIASPGMHERLMLWLNDKIEKPDKREKTEHSLIKYMIRMSSRCTPYGLFATCTAGVMGEETKIQFCNEEQVERFGRLDMDYVCGLHSQLVSHKTISRQLRFFPNSSLYRCGDYWRYVEQRFNKETARSYHLVEIGHSPGLEKILSAAEPGLKPEELAAIISDDEISSAEALDFIYELIDSQVLVDELNPVITGEEYFSVLLRRLKNLLHTEKYVERLEKAAELFKQIRRTDGPEKKAAYSQVVEELPQLEGGFQPKSIIQVDSYRPASLCMLNKKINDEILKGISLLQLLAGKETIPDPFADFKTAFSKRYDGEWIPLVEVLDTEWGIGYGKFTANGMGESPLVDKLQIGNSPGDSHLPKSRATEPFKWQLYEEAITKNKTEVRIDDNLIERLSKMEMNAGGLPDSFSVMVKINATKAKDIDSGNYTMDIQSIAGPSGGNLLGRFCHLHPGIEKLTRSILEEEEAHHPDCLYAEIVHLPESRTGNILMRPVLRKYEIPYLCNPSIDLEFEIPVSDLLVGIEANKVTLRSCMLNKQVIPRMTTAHNFNLTTLPVYQFLCDLQNQDVHHVDWNWGVLSNRPFLPQVRYGKFILSKARWILAKEEVSCCDDKHDEAVLSAFAEIRKQLKLPDYVLLTQGENELLLHLLNIYCIRLLLAEVNKAKSVILTEVTDTPDQCWIKSPGGNHAGEFIVAFSKKIALPRLPAIPSLEKQNKLIKRTFPVGSEWLSARIFCGTNTAEKLFSNVLRPFTEELLSKKLIDKFFFLRYNEEGHHIRIRFHNAEQKDFWRDVISLLQKTLQPFMDNRTVHNLQFETYRREIERYGFDTMVLSEDLFWHHSEAVMNFNSMLDGDDGEQYRWQAGLKAIDLFLDDFGYTLEHKCKLVKDLDRMYSEEFNIGYTERKKISEQFSNHKQQVNVLMSDAWQNDECLARAIPVFANRNESYRATVEGILIAPSVQGNPMQLDYLVQSYLHMFINRLFVSSQRKTELVIYEYLLKYYESKMARRKLDTVVSEL